MALFALVTGQAFLSMLPRGLWEDGYFAIRFARNTWLYGVAAWNVSDGPLHGMTSQLYQLLITALYPLSPRHLVTISKAVSAASLLGTVFCMLVWQPPSPRQAGRHALVIAGLSMPLVLNHITTGLETLLVLFWLALWLHEYRAYWAGGSSAVRMASFIAGMYLVRPEATLMLVVALLPCLLDQRRRTLRTLASAGIALSLCLIVFRLYYGTALPLAFYAKSAMMTNQPPEHVHLFWLEKLKNATQFAYFSAPFVLIAWIGRTRMALALLASAACFCAYHALFTVEIMGHHSRFYIPAIVPLIAAAMLGWEAFLERVRPRVVWGWLALWLAGYLVLKWVDGQSRIAIYVPFAREVGYVGAVTLVLLPLAAVRRRLWLPGAFAVAASAVLGYRIESLEVLSDRAILYRQIAPRAVFRGLPALERIKPKIVYHTDMGAPGVLLADAAVIDLDGLLSEDVLIRHKTFEELCQRDRPDAIFVPPPGSYPALRTAILESECFRDYRPLPQSAASRLALRADRYDAFMKAAAH